MGYNFKMVASKFKNPQAAPIFCSATNDLGNNPIQAFTTNGHETHEVASRNMEGLTSPPQCHLPPPPPKYIISISLK